MCGNLREDFGTFEDYLLKNGKTNKTEVVKAGTPGARKAELDYELIDCIETKEGVLTWILVILHTGRHHQIQYSLLLVDLDFMAIQNIIQSSRKRKRNIQRLDYILQGYPLIIR